MPLTVLNNLQSLRQFRKLHRRCKLWKITRLDGVILLFTDASQSVQLGADLYEPAGGFDATAVQKQTGLRPQNLEVMGALSSDRITDLDLHAGKYNDAAVEMRVVDWMFPWAQAFRYSRYIIRSASFSGEHWEVSMEGLAGLLTKPNGDVVSRVCQNDLGDGVCRVNLALALISRTVLSTSQLRLTFICNTAALTNPYVGGAIADEYFTHGLVTWTSGSNVGIVSEVKSHNQATGEISLELELPFDIQVGDGFDMVPGCGKLFDDNCQDKFDNGDNFLGAPDVPGTDKTLSPI